ncbi:hypothetical protein TNCV_4096961 [Trichonephila clavipes]|nr:hypothetical protein TNCV_4096961 [Trichonephila clavipes]
MTDKDIVECVKSSKNIFDTDSDSENASPVLKSSEMRNIMKKEKEEKEAVMLNAVSLCLGHQSLPPTTLGQVDEEMVPSGVGRIVPKEPFHAIKKIKFNGGLFAI